MNLVKHMLHCSSIQFKPLVVTISTHSNLMFPLIKRIINNKQQGKRVKMAISLKVSNPNQINRIPLKCARHPQLQMWINLNQSYLVISKQFILRTLPKRRNKINADQQTLHILSIQIWSRSSLHYYFLEQNHIFSEGSHATSLRLQTIKLLITIIIQKRRLF